MARMDAELETLCRSYPSHYQDVVITLTESAQHIKATDIGLPTAKEIGMGILSGTFTGQMLLELGKRPEVEEITFDIQISAY